MKQTIVMNQRQDHGELTAKIIKDAKAYAIRGVHSFFKPYADKAGKEVIELGEYKIINRASEKTTDFGTKVALAILAIVTQEFTEDRAKKARLILDADTAPHDYHLVNFNLVDFTKLVTGRSTTQKKTRVLEAIDALASNSSTILNEKTNEMLSLKWFVSPISDGKTIVLYISRYLLLQTFSHPLAFDFHKLFSLNNKDFRAGLLIESCRISNRKFAPFITNDIAIQEIRPRFKHGKPYLKEIENAFKNAAKAGYPLYKKTTIKYGEKAGEITWENQDDITCLSGNKTVEKSGEI